MWNLFFWQDSDLSDWDGRDEFEDIKRLLFRSLVRQKLSLDDEVRFLVVPRAKGGVPIMIEQPRPGTKNRYWDHPISRVTSTAAVLEFVDYFDFDGLGCLDFKYVLAKISAFPEYPELVGREALLETDHVDVYLPDAPGGTAPPL